MKKIYKSYFSFDIDIIKVKGIDLKENVYIKDEFSFEELGYQEYLNKENGVENSECNKENNVELIKRKEYKNNELYFEHDKVVENRRLSILEPVIEEKNDMNNICEYIDIMNLNNIENKTDNISGVNRLKAYGKFDKVEDNINLRSEGQYYLISMFNKPDNNIDKDDNNTRYDKILFKMGTVTTMNPYHVKSRSFRESIMFNYINERCMHYSKFQQCTIPYMLYQINISSIINKDDIPKLSQSSYKSGYSFTLEINEYHKRVCMLKKIIGCGANASVFSADICTIINDEVAGVFTCAMKIQHKDLGLNIRELYCGMALYKRNKKRIINTKNNFYLLKNENDIDIKRRKDNFCDLNLINKENSPYIQRTARSSISTFLPGSNLASNRNSINSNNDQINENTRIEIDFQRSNSISSQRNSILSKKTIDRSSISSNYSFNYLESPSDGSVLIEPIVINNGITVFCITELYIVSSSISGMIQNILNREMIKFNNENDKVNNNNNESTNNSVGISILPTAFSSTSLQNILNEYYLKNGITMEEPVVLFLTFQFIQVILAFNEMKIIHGDIKPDNILLYPNPDFELEINYSNNRNYHPLIPENLNLPIHMSIIDLGRSLDIHEIYRNTLFEGNCHAKSFIPPTMIENLPWLHHIDIFGIASTVHCLITGRYMELVKWDDQVLKCKNNKMNNQNFEDGYTFKIYNYKIKNQSSCIKRNWNCEFWSEFMNNCINFCPILQSSASLNDEKQFEFIKENQIENHNENFQDDVHYTIDELSLNISNFLNKIQNDIINIFNKDIKMKDNLYKQLLNIRKKLQSTPINI